MLSRRSFLFGAGAAACHAFDPQQPGLYPPDARRYNDGATEFPVFRLTSPEYTSLLPAYQNRGMSRNAFALVASDRAGKMDAFRLDVKNFEMRRITAAARLLPSSLCLLPGDRTFVYADGDTLKLSALGSGRARDIWKGEGEITAASVSDDGVRAAVIETIGRKWRLSAVSVAKGTARVLAEAPEPLTDPVHRPRRDAVLYRRGTDSLWIAETDGGRNYRLRVQAGEIASPQWSPDGTTVFYLSLPSDPALKNQIREFHPDANEDRLLAPTTRFVHFRANGDASVFAGASGSQAAPHVLLLLRSVKREFTLCEHRASDPRALTRPVFSPDSQRVFFVSDQHGKPALYMMNIERLVEETKSDVSS